MAFFEQDFINELLAKTDIESVISDYVTLQNKSGRLWGLCPFHGEKTPSFSVTKEKQIFYCFGCHEGGNAISFLMKIDKLTFPEAVERLAERAGMPLPEQKTNNADYEKNKQRKQRIYEINRLAAHYFYDLLNGDKGKKAKAYLEKRGLSSKTITKFGLGYAAETWDDLLLHLQAKGCKIDEVKEAGLCSVKNGKAFDTFRARVVFPIINIFGEVIGFGGRVMDDSSPKYLNTSDTLAFNKRRNVYSLNFVKAIKKIQSVVLVEGYMDVISLYERGVVNAVATLGTALTREQAQLIKRYVPLVYVAYDGDNAGQKATEKALDIVESVGLKAKVIAFTEGMDPDEYIKTFGYAEFVKQAKSAKEATDFRLDRIKRGFDLSSFEDKATYIVQGTKVLKKLKNPIEREQYILRLSKETGHSVQAIKDQMDSVTRGEEKAAIKTLTEQNEGEVPDKDIQIKEEKMLAAYFLKFPKKTAFYDIDRIMPYLMLTEVKEIVNFINLKIKEGILPTDAEIVTVISDEAKVLASELITTISDFELRGITPENIITEIESRGIKKQLDILLNKYKNENDKEAYKKYQELNKELHNKKRRPN
ncbi:MAG: DNA primase [Eubacteriales bacterium]